MQPEQCSCFRIEILSLEKGYILYSYIIYVGSIFMDMQVKKTHAQCFNGIKVLLNSSLNWRASSAERVPTEVYPITFTAHSLLPEIFICAAINVVGLTSFVMLSCLSPSSLHLRRSFSLFI